MNLKERRVLMLGAGFVAKPTLQTLHKQGIIINVEIHFRASNDLDGAHNVCRGFENAKPMYIDVTNEHDLDMAVAEVDLVVSLIPYTFHVTVVRSAIRNKKHVVTTSYISPAMRELDDAAKAAGILVLNECGLDPGIDHLLAIKTIDEVHRAGGSIRSLRSYCGALPAPESADNPLGYKFSWSPRGVLLALRNTAKYYVDGSIQEVAGTNLMDHARPYCQLGRHDLVAYPNRDSTAYRSCYNIPEAGTVIRSTLRYAKFPAIVKALANIGFLDEKPVPYLDPLRKALAWREATRLIIDAFSSDERDLSTAILSKTTFNSTQERSQVIDGLKWIGLFSDDAVKPRQSPLDTLCATLEEKLRYGSEERDMVILQHQFEIEHQNGDLEARCVSMTEFGDPTGHSALAKLVGTPCAIAAKKVLDGSISGTGVLAPLEWKVAQPIVEELGTCGIRAHIERSFRPKLTKSLINVEVNAIKVA